MERDYVKKILFYSFLSIIFGGLQKKLSFHTVCFVDYDDTAISQVNVKDGENVTPPNNPSRDGFIFVGWDQKTTNITSDLTIRAIYVDEKTLFKINFDKGNNEYPLEYVEVHYGERLTLPVANKEGFNFIEWELNGEPVTNNFTFNFIKDIIWMEWRLSCRLGNK